MTVAEYWTGAAVDVSAGWLDAGVLAPHSASVVQIPFAAPGRPTASGEDAP